MSLGRRSGERQGEFWVEASRLSDGPRNAFYDRLNELLAEIGFDRQLEGAAAPFYKKTGRKGLAPGVYFRMILIGYFEDISSQRGIAWRCGDSRSLSRFLGFSPGESTPDHSTLSLTRDRLPMEIHSLAFGLVLQAAEEHGLLKGKTIGVDATNLEANASMKSIVRRDNGDDWREYIRKLYEEETGEAKSDRRRASPLRQKPQEQEGKQRRLGELERRGGSDRQDERRSHAPELQGRKRGRPRHRTDRCRRSLLR